MIRDQVLKPVPEGTPAFSEHVEFVKKVIAKKESFEQERLLEAQTTQEQFPRSFLFAQLQQLVLSKKGLSDFELFSGVSEMLMGRPQFQRALKPALSERFLEPEVKDPKPPL